MSHYYYSYKQYLKERYPYRIQKIPLDAGFTCPNRDGTVAVGGCTYCDNRSFSPNSRGRRLSIRQQMEEGIRFYRQRSGAEKFIAYFQAYTNTYGAPELLKLRYDEALEHPDVIGLSISTRPDCIDDEILDLLEDYGSRVDLWIEYGLQSMHDETLRRVNRGHNFQQFCEAVQRTRTRGMRVCAHLILGMPGEDRAIMMMQTAEAVARLGVDGVKITHLYVARSTPLELSFQRGEFSTLSLEGYIALLCDTLERIPPGVVIQRVMGELGGPYVVAPLWQKSKREILDRISEEFAQRGTRQGSRVKESRETVGSAF